MKRVTSRIGWIILSVILFCASFSFAGTCPIRWSYSINGITALSISENGEYIAIGCQDGYYYLFDTWSNCTGSGQVPTAVTCLDVANTGNVLLGSATGYTFCSEDGSQGSSFRTASVKTVSMSSEGTMSIVCSRNNILINVEDSMVQQLQVGADSPFGVISSDSSLACVASGRYLYLFYDGNFQESFEMKEDIGYLFVSADGNTIVFSAREKEIGYLDMEKLELQFVDLDSPMTSMTVSADGRTVLVSTADNLVWLKEGKITNKLAVDEAQCLSLSKDGSLAVIKKNDSIIQVIAGGAPVYTYDLESHIVASEIAENLLVTCTDTSVYTFQLFEKAKNNNIFDPLSSRKSLPLTSPIKEVWSLPVAEDSGFRTADVDGDGITDIILREETMVKLLDKNGTQKFAEDLEEPINVALPLDFDGNTTLEIPIYFEHDGFIFSIYEWKRGFTRTYNLESLRDQPSPEGCVIPFAVLDADNDGDREILATVYVGYLCEPRGVVSIDYVSGDIEWFYQMGAPLWPHIVDDIDGDGTIEIVSGSMAPCNCPEGSQFPDCETYVIALSVTGEELWKVYLGEGFRRVKTCAADINECEGKEVIGFAYEASQNWGRLFVLTCSGEYLYDFEADYSIYIGAVVDIDGDNLKEIVALDSRGYISAFTPDLQLKSETFINNNITSASPVHLNDLDGDGFCDIVVGVDNELYILDKDLEIVWKKEFDRKINMVEVAHFNQCKNTLLVLSDKLYAFSYQDAGDMPCPLWEITERTLTEEATKYVDTAESLYTAGDYQVSRQYYERALAIFSQLENQNMMDTVSKRVAELTGIIFKVNVRIGIVVLAASSIGFCVFLVYSWVTKRRWSRLAEGALLLSLPVLLGLFRVYHAHEEYTLVFARYFVPSFVLSSAVLLRKSILGFLRTIAAVVSGHKDMLVLSITESNGAYRVSVESIEEKFRPVKESREVVFSEETRENIIKKVEFMVGVLGQYSSASQDMALNFAVEDLRKNGATIYQKFIPEDFSDILKAKFLMLEVEDTDIPWELMYADGFFASKYAISRRIVTTESVNVRPSGKHGRRALIISDPTDTLPGAKTECIIVYKRLKQKMDAVLVEGRNGTLQRIANLLGQGFDIIHFAGHVENELELSDGVLTPQNVREFVTGTPVVFVNGCKSEDLARAFLLGGAMAYVGTIHPVHDGSAAGIAADFYDFCLQYRIGEALRRARELHRDKDLAWASLVMYGDPTLKLL